jgi:phage-related holin
MVFLGIIAAVIVWIIPIVLIGVIISAIVKKSKDSKTGFEEIVRNVYIYIVLIITLIAIIAGTISVFRVGLDIILPEKTTYESSSYVYEKNKNSNIIELFTELAIVLSATPVFIYHNKIAKKSREIKVNIQENETNN